MNVKDKTRNGILQHYIGTLFPKTNPTKRYHSIAWKYLIQEIAIPLLAGIVVWACSITLTRADIIVSALGVLGGLLFAHAIFVFEMRMSYMANVRSKIKEGISSGENLQLTRLIDELFYSVVYSSALALGVTIAISTGASLGIYWRIGDTGRRILSSLIIVVIAHLAMCIYRVLRTTAGAYGELRKERIV